MFLVRFCLGNISAFRFVFKKKKLERQVFHFIINFFFSSGALVSLMSCSSGFAQKEVRVNFVHVFVLLKTIVFVET